MRQIMMCTRCHKRPAVIFTGRFENGKPVNEGFCLQCAKELGIPQVKELMDNMGITDEDLETMSNQFLEMMNGEEGFEPGGAMPFPLMNMMGDEIEADGEALPDTIEEESADGETPAPEKKRKKYKYLDSYCENLNDKVKNGKVDRIVGRESEIYRVMQILNRRTKTTPA